MRVNIYDKNPGTGFDQWLLKVTWIVGCFFQKLFRVIDDYKGVASWKEAEEWLLSLKKVSHIQYWGHGSPGCVWISQKYVSMSEWESLKPVVTPETVIWFRTCSTFQGLRGQHYSKTISNTLNCTIGGHTRIIGLLHGGLHTRRPNTDPSWPVTEGELPPSWIPSHFRWGNNTVWFWATKIPEGW